MLHTLRIYHPSLSGKKMWKILSRNPYDLLCCSTYCIFYIFFLEGFFHVSNIKNELKVILTFFIHIFFFLNIAIDRTGLKVYIISIITPYNCQNIYPQEVVVEEEENEIPKGGKKFVDFYC